MGIKYAVNSSFFEKWSHESAYILGFLYADGSLEDSPYIRGRYLRVTSTDRDRIDLIRKSLSSGHSVVNRKIVGNRKQSFLLRIGSHSLYESLIKHGLTPRKSLTMKFPNVPKKYLGAFVCGYFDGDGCVYIEKRKNRTFGRLITIFTSGSRAFFEKMYSVLLKNGLTESKSIYRHSNKRNYQLRYSTTNSVLLFGLMYKDTLHRRLPMMRKYAIFKQYFEVRSTVLTNKGRQILKEGPMAK